MTERSTQDSSTICQKRNKPGLLSARFFASIDKPSRLLKSFAMSSPYVRRKSGMLAVEAIARDRITRARIPCPGGAATVHLQIRLSMLQELPQYDCRPNTTVEHFYPIQRLPDGPTTPCSPGTPVCTPFNSIARQPVLEYIA